MEKHPVVHDPVLIAETEGEQRIEVYQGDFMQLFQVIPQGNSPVTAIDLFDKNDLTTINKFKTEWIEKIGGDVFVP
jgi:hypothetical protein